MTEQITQLEAYMIETLRYHGVSNQEILRNISNGYIKDWQEQLNTHFDFSMLLTLAQKDQQAFTTIISTGYQVKYVTVKGLQTLLQLKFHKQPDVDYTLMEKGIINLKISNSDQKILEELLSSNWVLKKDTDHKGITITPR